MKIDTIQTLMNRFNQSHRVLWYNTITFESIQAKKKWKIYAVNIWIDSEILWIDSRKLWIYSGNLWIDSLRYYSGKLLIDSLRYYSGKYDSIQKDRQMENGQKEW